jgi:hypothetical protein
MWILTSQLEVIMQMESNNCEIISVGSGTEVGIGGDINQQRLASKPIQIRIKLDHHFWAGFLFGPSRGSTGR